MLHVRLIGTQIFGKSFLSTTFPDILGYESLIYLSQAQFTLIFNKQIVCECKTKILLLSLCTEERCLSSFC